jgi:hypothetical protein
MCTVYLERVHPSIIFPFLLSLFPPLSNRFHKWVRTCDIYPYELGISFFFLAVLGFGIQDLTLARQVLYHLTYSTSSFLCWVFLRWGLMELFALLASDYNPPDLCLLSS